MLLADYVIQGKVQEDMKKNALPKKVFTGGDYSATGDVYSDVD